MPAAAAAATPTARNFLRETLDKSGTYTLGTLVHIESLVSLLVVTKSILYYRYCHIECYKIRLYVLTS